MKKTLLIFLLCLCGKGAQAQSCDYLTLQSANGSKESFATAEGLKITFLGDVAKVHAAGAEATFPLAQLTSMFFEETPTGLNRLVASPTEDGPDAVYSLDGRRVGSNISRLPMKNGVYIVRKQGKTQKLLVR